MTLEALLAACLRKGGRDLETLAARALRRLLAGGIDDVMRARSLLDDPEKAQLAGRFAAFNAVAELLGRQRVRAKWRATRAFNATAKFNAVAKFNEQDATDWNALLGLAPRAAIDWFRDLMPVDHLDAPLFDFQHQGQAFALAATTDAVVLKKVHQAILDRIETGKQVSAGPRVIAEILDDAGVTYRKGYPELVFRTNVMEAYRNGGWAEFRDPDVAPFFPVWRYVGIADGRERMGPLPEKPDHHRHFGKYYPASISFFDVRGRQARDVMNCLLPGTLIRGRHVAASKAWYAGDACKVKMASGAFYTVTANHPVLAEDRLVAAGQLHKGLKAWTYLVDQQAGANGDVDQRPARVEDVFDAGTPVLRREAVSSLDFHGDGQFIQGDIDVVRTHGDRLPVGMAHQRQQVANVGLETPLPHFVGVADLREPLFFGHLRPLERLRFAAASRDNSSLGQLRADRSARRFEMRGERVFGNALLDVHPREFADGKSLLLPLGESEPEAPLVGRLDVHAEPLGHLVDGHVGQKQLTHPFGRRNAQELPLLLDRADLDIVFPEEAFREVAAYASLLRNVNDRCPGQILLDEVVSVERFHYEGPVYDVETDTGYYTAGGSESASALLKNCRCNFQPITAREWARREAAGAVLELVP